jgi:tetratricopeptide (TPR) repeat protein
MIRRDYLLRAVEQCIQALSRSLALRQQAEFELARLEVDQAMRTLTGLDVAQAGERSETELIALLLDGGPTQLVRQKCMLLVALLREAGDTHAGQSRIEESRRCYLKALNLDLTVLLREGPFECPEYVPSVDALVSGLRSQGEPLPAGTAAALMEHYETVGQFAKAEDALFALLESEPSNGAFAELGLEFYNRLLRRPDEALECGNLPRSEVNAGIAELKARVQV